MEDESNMQSNERVYERRMMKEEKGERHEQVQHRPLISSDTNWPTCPNKDLPLSRVHGPPTQRLVNQGSPQRPPLSPIDSAMSETGMPKFILLSR